MDNPKVIVRETKRFGKSLFANDLIKEGEIIALFDGPIFDYNYYGWTQELEDHCIQFGKRKWRDSIGFARYINHSCEPNCGVKDLFKIIAMRDIKGGEELTWDYEMTEDNEIWRMKCLCGSKKCRGEIGAYRNMPQEVREKYKGFISEWLY